MQLQAAITSLESACRRDRKSRETLKAYRGWARSYGRFLRAHPEHANSTQEEKVAAYLESLSTHAAATQRQALNAVVYLYRAALDSPLGDLPAWTYSRRPQRLPTFLTPAECLALFRHLDGVHRLIAELMFGSGLRLREALGLRVQDIDLETLGVRVRSGKGDKSRTTCLPRALVEPLREQLDVCRDLWRSDRADEINPVQLPAGLERKFPRGGRELEWYWLFAAPARCRSTGGRDRWHVHPNTFGRALTRARRAAGLGKRVTAHTLRHSFATAALQAGMPIHELQELMGHQSISTTEVYLHCLPQLSSRSTSPLDAALSGDASNVVPFAPQPETAAAS